MDSYFGPVWEIFDKARKVNPFFGYAAPALLLVVTFVFINQWLGKVSVVEGLDPIRTILLVVYIMVTILAFLAILSGIFVEPLSLNMLVHTIVRLFFFALLVALGVFTIFLSTENSDKFCRYHRVVVGLDAPCKPPPVQDLPIATGIVKVGNKWTQIINPDDIVVRIKAKKELLDANVGRNGNFSIELPLSEVGNEAFAAVDFKNQGEQQSDFVKISDAGAHFGTFEFSDVSTAAERQAVPIRNAEDSLPILEGRQILPVNTKNAAFSGLGWRYDIFYCKAPIGNELQSEKLARQLKNVIQVQDGVSSVTIKLWPSNRSGYRLRNGELQINTPVDNSEKNAQADRIAKLLQPFLDDGEFAAIRPVTSDFRNYLSLVACRQGS